MSRLEDRTVRLEDRTVHNGERIDAMEENIKLIRNDVNAEKANSGQIRTQVARDLLLEQRDMDSRLNNVIIYKIKEALDSIMDGKIRTDHDLGMVQMVMDGIHCNCI